MRHLALLLAPALLAQAPLPKPALPGWLAGTWIGEAGGVRQEETWSGPEQGHIQGMYREQKDGRVLVMELLSLAEEPDGLWLTMRHFGPALQPREPADAPLRWRLSQPGPDRALFSNPAEGATLDYRLEGDALHIRLEIKRKDKSHLETFVLRRQRP